MCKISHVDFIYLLALFALESFIFKDKGLNKDIDKLKCTQAELSFQKFPDLGKNKKSRHILPSVEHW